MARYLISRLSALGDTICCLPAATALKKGDPDGHITWLVDPRFKSIVACCTAVDQVVPYKPGLRSLRPVSESFDVALDLQGLLKSALPIFFARATRKVGYHWQREASALASSRVLPDASSLHVVDQYVDVARAVGGIADRAEFALVPKNADILSIRSKLKAEGLSGRFAVINPGAGWVSKRWPVGHFSALIDGLGEIGVGSAVIGSPSDRENAEELLRLCQSKPADLVGKTSVAELIALIRLCSLHIGGDTGSSHLAAALNIPAIGLYGITDPIRSCPYGQIENCFYEPLGLDRIEAEAVLARALALLSR